MKLANIALRNISRQKRRTALLASAIAICIFIVTLVNSLSAGTVYMLRENMADLIGGHVFVVMQHRVGDRTQSYISDDAKLMAALKKLNVREDQIAKTVDIEDGSLIFNGNDHMQIMVGVEWNENSDIQKKLGIPHEQFLKVLQDSNGLIISRKTADKLKIQLGDTVQYKCRTISGQQNFNDFKVSFITNDTTEFGGMVSFANRQVVNELVNLPTPNTYLTMRIRLGSIDAANDFAAKLEKDLAADFQIAPKQTNLGNIMEDSVIQWNFNTGFTGERLKITTINDMYFLSIMNQMAAFMTGVSLLLLMVLLAITMLGIANTFRMILYERITEIGTMRALGMHRNEIRRIMLLEAVFISLLGVVSGIILAGIAMVLIGLADFGTQTSAAIFLHMGHLSFRFDLGSMISSTILVVVFTLLAAMRPAGKAAKLAPAEALRSIN